MRRATYGLIIVSTTDLISIHALHEESDQSYERVSTKLSISIHALHEESDRIMRIRRSAARFQSTLSMRRATGARTRIFYKTTAFQSTLSMRRATYARFGIWVSVSISIHALHEESDHTANSHSKPPKFQSTLSMRRATVFHVIRSRQRCDFNPRSP